MGAGCHFTKRVTMEAERGRTSLLAVWTDSDEARACIPLPAFDLSLLEITKSISERYRFAETKYRHSREKQRSTEEIPHFEKVFRIAAAMAGIADVEKNRDYDQLLILTAWKC